MSDLGTELETELRALDIAPAPVAGTMRAGRRLRHRRHFAVAAGVVAVIAVAAGVPALTHLGAAPAPPISRPAHRDPVVTDIPPGKGAPVGEIARGTVGAQWWRLTVSKSSLGRAAAIDYCVNVAGTIPGSPDVGCGPVETSAAPATFESQGPNPEGTAEATVGTVATDVAYLNLRFTDGQQFKLVPVTFDGHRWVAFIAPVSMTIASVTAHLGAGGRDSGQILTAVPFSLPGGLPLLNLWQRPGQAAPPRATRLLASGTADGKRWGLTAYEGPWGTCFVFKQTNGTTTGCERSARMVKTEILGGWGGDGWGQTVYGSAAPGVAYVEVRLSDGRKVSVTPATVGNEWLFAFPVGAGISPTGWTAYSASGKVAGTGSA